MHSRNSSAPCSRIRRPIRFDTRLYAASFFFGTGVTNPSTYAMALLLLAEVALEAVDRRRPAAVVGVSRRLVEELLVAEVELGAAACCLEHDRHDRLALGRSPRPRPGEDQPLVRHDLLI